MNEANTKDYLPLVQALSQGRTIQEEIYTGVWEDRTDVRFVRDPKYYRVKRKTVKLYVATRFHGGQILSTTHTSRGYLEKLYRTYPDFELHEQMNALNFCTSGLSHERNKWRSDDYVAVANILESNAHIYQHCADELARVLAGETPPAPGEAWETKQEKP